MMPGVDSPFDNGFRQAQACRFSGFQHPHQTRKRNKEAFYMLLTFVGRDFSFVYSCVLHSSCQQHEAFFQTLGGHRFFCIFPFIRFCFAFVLKTKIKSTINAWMRSHATPPFGIRRRELDSCVSACEFHCWLHLCFNFNKNNETCPFAIVDPFHICLCISCFVSINTSLEEHTQDILSGWIKSKSW